MIVVGAACLLMIEILSRVRYNSDEYREIQKDVCPDLRTACLHVAMPLLRKTQVCNRMLLTRAQFCVMETMDS